MTSRVASESLDDGDRPEKKQKTSEAEPLQFLESFYGFGADGSTPAMIQLYKLDLPARVNLPWTCLIPGTGATLMLEAGSGALVNIKYMPVKNAKEVVNFYGRNGPLMHYGKLVTISDMTWEWTSTAFVHVTIGLDKSMSIPKPFQVSSGTASKPDVVRFKLSNNSFIDVFRSQVASMSLVVGGTNFKDNNEVDLTHFDAKTVEFFFERYLGKLPLPMQQWPEDVNPVQLAHLCNELLLRPDAKPYEPSHLPLFYHWTWSFAFSTTAYADGKQLQTSLSTLAKWYAFGSILHKCRLPEYLDTIVACVRKTRSMYV
jgi:hypothetical protein